MLRAMICLALLHSFLVCAGRLNPDSVLYYPLLGHSRRLFVGASKGVVGSESSQGCFSSEPSAAQVGFYFPLWDAIGSACETLLVTKSVFFP